jgi:uncharacterized protein YggT (Ycf19 family)
MAAQERYERREEQRTGDGAVAGRRVEQVREVDQANNVTPFPPRAVPSSATNVNVAQRHRAAPAAPGYVEANSAAVAVGKVNQVLWFLCAVLELLLGLRVVLRLMGANAAAPFVGFIYSVTQPLAAPFFGMLPNLAAPDIRAGAFLEIPTLIAMVVYFLVFLLLTYLLRLLVSRPANI